MNRNLKEIQKRDDNYLNVMLGTSLAEMGSALEMLAACKNSQKSNFAYGYFEHAKDEYNHTKIFLSLLGNYAKSFKSEFSRKFRFNSISLKSKGYVSNEGFLIETMKLKDFKD